MTSLPTARGDQVIARQVIRRLLWTLRHCYGNQPHADDDIRDRIRALWKDR
jgi:hypothetical protein